MSKSAFTPFGLVQHLYCNEFGLLVTGYHHLGYALSVVDNEGLLAQIDQDDANLSPIIGIDGTRGIEHRDTVLQSQSATGTYLSLVAGRESYAQTCGYQLTFQGLQSDGGIEVCTQVHTCRKGSRITWQSMMRTINNLDFHTYSF